MEVTRKNFKEVLPLVEKSIKDADFLVIDTEFTGLMNGREVSMFDSPEEYYTKILNGCSDFMVLQYGLCAFYWNEEKKHYMNDAYNFYLFPRVRPGPERMFLCQSSSLDFLASQGFDFNKVFREGIPFMTEPTETRLREQLMERQKSYSNDSHITVPEENKQQIDDICKRVRTFLDEKKVDEIEIDRCNPFIRKLLFQELGSQFKNEVFVETKVLENKNRVLKVSRITSENESRNRDNMKKEKEWEDFEESVGFSKVARMISQSNKCVIGHNMVHDLLHTLSHFFAPLPQDYAAFKEFAHCMFPKLLDTKYMSSLPPFKDKVNSNALTHLFAALSEEPFTVPRVVTKKGHGYTSADDKQHEAGYDAYVTGLCFLAMHGHLSRMRGEENARVSSDSAILKPFINKIYLMKTAHQNSPYMNLAGKEPSPSRDHVLHMTFPKEWQRSDINQLFSPFGPIIVKFEDDTTAFVSLPGRDQAAAAARALRGHGRLQLLPYTTYMAKMQNKDKQWRKPENSPSSISNNQENLQKWRPAIPAQSYIPEKVERHIKPQEAKSEDKEEKLPEAKERRRSLSATVTSPVAKTTRKRTSSGVFQIENSEPLPKKAEKTRPPAEETRAHPELSRNGRRKTSETELPKKAIEILDKPTSKVVSAFQESDSWE